MKKPALALNILAFAAVFLAYTAAAEAERPTGVRRALQTYAGEVSVDAQPVTDAVVLSLAESRREISQ